MKRYVAHIILLLSIMLVSCIETIDIERNLEGTLAAEDILVVEATITDELKKQEVYLSRAASFRNDSIIDFDQLDNLNPNVPPSLLQERPILYERNATVKIVDDSNQEIQLVEEDPGRYVSELPFAATLGLGYRLEILTASGEVYRSEITSLSGISEITDLYAERIVDDFGDEGIAIYLDSEGTEGAVNYYRYTFQETYKIIAPNWTPNEFKILNDGSVLGETPAVTTVPRAQEERVCYNTEPQREVILNSTMGLTGPLVKRFLVRYISRNNFIISHRYSILVFQLVQSQSAYTYFDTLKQFSKSEGVFSQVQPGFLEGNIRAENSSTKVLGYFDVASVSKQRLFFNYEDLFPGELLPPYPGAACDRLFSPCLGDPELDGPKILECPSTTLVEAIKLGLVEYVDANENPGLCEGPYYVTNRACGDCTILGSNVIPEFWTE